MKMLQKFHCEHVLKELNDFGLYQKKLIFCFIMPMALLSAFQSTYVYNEFVPDHWCKVELLVNFSYGEQHRLIRPRLRPINDDLPDIESLSNCEMFDIDYYEVLNGLELPKNRSVIPIKKCSRQNGWVYNQNEFRENAAIHYNFVCDQRNRIQIIGLVRKLSSALFSLFYAILADKYGRKMALIFVLTAFILSAISPLLTTNYYAFLACQALQGSTWPIGILIGIILGLEFVTPEYRSDVLALAGLSYHFGEWMAFLVAKILPHWIWISISNTCLTLPYFLFYHFCDESPQWLLATKRFSKLKDLFVKLNRVNGGPLDNVSIGSIISKFTHYYNYDRCEEVSLAISMQNLCEPSQSHSQLQQKTIKKGNSHHTNHNNNVCNDKFNQFDRADFTKSCDSFLNDDDNQDVGDESKTSFMKRIRLFIKRSTLFQMIFLWAIVLIANELIIDFLNKRKNRFDDNMLVDRFLGSLIKMPIILLTWYLVNQCFGRRWSNCIILTLNLVLLMLIFFGHSLIKNIVWLNVTISVLGVMLAECSELITILQTLELTSTRYRAIVASIVHLISQSAVIFIIYWLYNHNLRLIFTVHTKLIFISCVTLISIIIASFVTETRNEFLPMGALESEQLITNFHYWSMGKKRSDIVPSNLFISLSKWDVNANHQIVGSIKQLDRFSDSWQKFQIITNL